MSRILIYGATGYVGKLFTKELLERGVRPVLAGRSQAVRGLAESLGCQSAIFGLNEAEKISDALAEVDLLVNLAGPFVRSQQPLIEASLVAGCHYIDIAGEVDEMLSAYAFDEAAIQAGIMVMPGAGFGVVPTDIAASMASKRLPDATHLTILYATEGGVSRGTLKTVLQDINKPGVRRVNCRHSRPHLREDKIRRGSIASPTSGCRSRSGRKAPQLPRA